MSKDGDTPITCSVCGHTFPKRKMTGIGSSYRMTWLCLDCVVPNVDRVMGQAFDRAANEAVAEYERGETKSITDFAAEHDIDPEAR